MLEMSKECESENRSELRNCDKFRETLISKLQ